MTDISLSYAGTDFCADNSSGSFHRDVNEHPVIADEIYVYVVGVYVIGVSCWLSFYTSAALAAVWQLLTVPAEIR